MDIGMTTPAYINAACLHVLFLEFFAEPLVAMAGARNKMMKGQRFIGTAQRTAL